MSSFKFFQKLFMLHLLLVSLAFSQDDESTQKEILNLLGHLESENSNAIYLYKQASASSAENWEDTELSEMEKSLPPGVISVNKTPNKFLKGIIQYKDVKDERAFFIHLFQVDRSKYPDRIRIRLIILDENGNFIANLAPPYAPLGTFKKHFIKVVESIETTNVTVSDFTVREVHGGLIKPRSHSLVLDYSGSMNSDIDSLEDAVGSFLSSLSGYKNQEACIVKFDDHLELAVPFSLGPALPGLFHRTGLNDFGGGTALYAAAGLGLSELKKTESNRERSLVLFTDGGENSSFGYAMGNGGIYQLEEVIYGARDIGASITTIGFGGADEGALREIAECSDGGFFAATDASDLIDIYGALPLLSSNYYEVSYKPRLQSIKRSVELSVRLGDDLIITASRQVFTGKYPKPAASDTKKDFPKQVLANFAADSSSVRAEDIAKIKKITQFLEQNPELNIILFGHTDKRKDNKYNARLSFWRCEQVKKYLKKYGISSKRITIKARGEEEPIWSNEGQKTARAENRRVEYKLVRS